MTRVKRVLASVLWVPPIACFAQAQSIPIDPPVVAGSQCFPGGINEAGQAVVWCTGPNRAFVWSFSDQSFVEVTHPGISQVGASPINNLGQVGGWACTPSFVCEAFIWTPGVGMTFVGEGQVESLNDSGDSVKRVQGGLAWQFRRADGSVYPLPVGWVPAVTQSLNNLSQVGLIANDANTPRFGVWSPTQGLVQLPTAPSPTPANVFYDMTFHAFALNDAGKLVGDVNGKGIVYTPGAGYAILQGGVITKAYHISALGTIAGESSPDGVEFRAAVWTSPNILTTGPAGTYAWAINSAGQVLGLQSTASGPKTVGWIVPVTPPTPAQEIQAVQSQVDDFLVSGAISENDFKALVAKLDGATKAIAKADTPAAKNLLTSMSNQVAALERSGRIAPAIASSLQILISQAQAGM